MFNRKHVQQTSYWSSYNGDVFSLEAQPRLEDAYMDTEKHHFSRADLQKYQVVSKDQFHKLWAVSLCIKLLITLTALTPSICKPIKSHYIRDLSWQIIWNYEPQQHFSTRQFLVGLAHTYIILIFFLISNMVNQVVHRKRRYACAIIIHFQHCPLLYSIQLCSIWSYFPPKLLYGTMAFLMLDISQLTSEKKGMNGRWKRDKLSYY